MLVGFTLFALAMYIWVIRNPSARLARSSNACSACGKRVELDAAECRHCGARLRRKKKRRKRRTNPEQHAHSEGDA